MPGQRLPPERELAERFGVNRVTVRSALARLQASGLLEAQQGRGTTVRDPRRVGGPDLLPDLVEQARQRGQIKRIAAEIFQVRQHLARALLERLAERRPDPAPFMRAVARFAATDPEDLSALAEADADVLAVLLEMADSLVLQLCLNPVRRLLTEQAQLRAAIYREPAANLAGWQALGLWLNDPQHAEIATIIELVSERDRAAVEGL